MRALLRAAASPKLAATFFVVTAAGALYARVPERSATLAMLVPFALLTINLFAAIVTNPRFRADVPLLVFHLALLMLAVTLTIARLTYFEGQTTVTSGMAFDGYLISEKSGALHARDIDAIRFTNLGFTENYPARGQFHATYNRVQWVTPDGKRHEADIGDDIPLVLKGYRFYTTRHRGFSPVFRWRAAADGTEIWGTVQLSDSSNGAFAGANDWTLPNGQAAWLMIETDELQPVESGITRANLDTAAGREILVRLDEARISLKPGDSLELDGGTLTYERLDSWMGYRIIYDPTKAWLIGAVAIGVVALVWFYARIVLRPIPIANEST